MYEEEILEYSAETGEDFWSDVSIDVDDELIVD